MRESWKRQSLHSSSAAAKVKRLVDDARMYARFATGMRRFLRSPPQFEAALARVEGSIANREKNLIRLVEVGVFQHSRSPYRPLFDKAGRSFENVCSLVGTHGVEGALRVLRDDAVFVSFEEFKGRTPIIRGDLRLSVSDRDFDNPRMRTHYEGTTGGSTGAGTRVATDLDHLALMIEQSKVYLGLMKDESLPMAVWFPVLPAASGLSAVLMMTMLGFSTEKWFTPVTSEKMRIPRKYRIATDYARGMAKLLGVGIPPPEVVPVSDARKVAAWAGDAIRREGACYVATYVSLAVRVSIAAQEMGIDLTGLTIFATGEPPTPAKVNAIQACGARFRSAYGFTEGGLLGVSCGNPLNGTDVHVYRDQWAVLQTRVDVPASTMSVDAFSFTSLFATTPKVILNVELDDYGVLERRQCGCPLMELFPDHIRDVYSFRKLTGEGMTLVGSTMLRILEEVLPDQFGGTALDYQLVEEEDDAGFTRLTIVVSPTVGDVDEAAMIETVLGEVSRDSAGADLARAVWKDAGTFRIRRADPTWSTLGKLMSLRPGKRQAAKVRVEAARR